MAARLDGSGLLPEARATVLCFASLWDEPDTRPVLSLLRARGLMIVMPAMSNREGAPELRRLPASASLAPGGEGWIRDSFGVWTPSGPPAPGSAISLALIPGRAFDLTGTRVGRGGGHFDRLLASLPNGCMRIGFAFEAQVVDSLPREEHDAPMHALVTPLRSLQFRAR